MQTFSWIDGGNLRNISVRITCVWVGTCLSFHFFVSGIIIGGGYSHSLSFGFDLVELNVYCSRNVCGIERKSSCLCSNFAAVFRAVTII
jgi:hypothetical protein